MKLLITLLCLGLSSLAVATDLKTCQQYNRDIIEKPVTTVPDGYEFEKDEKKALFYIEAFDAEKLGFELDQASRAVSLKSCEFNHEYCQTGLETYAFFRALLHATKKYPWSEPTKKLALEKFQSYQNTVLSLKTKSLLDVALLSTLLEKFESTPARAKLKLEIDTAAKKFGDELKKQGKLDCDSSRAVIKKEAELAESFALKFKGLKL